MSGDLSSETRTTAAQRLRQLADRLEQGLDHEQVRRVLHNITWPLQQEADPTGHATDFLIRNALIEATCRMDRERSPYAPREFDDEDIDYLGWALTRDGWWPRPDAWIDCDWLVAWKPGDTPNDMQTRLTPPRNPAERGCFT